MKMCGILLMLNGEEKDEENEEENEEKEEEKSEENEEKEEEEEEKSEEKENEEKKKEKGEKVKDEKEREKKEEGKEKKKRRENGKKGIKKDNKEILSPFAEGVDLLKKAYEEGCVCFGRDHYEMVEIKNWLDGEWRILPCLEVRKEILKNCGDKP
jgi:chemotaxis protein histidine kinase CheA